MTQKIVKNKKDNDISIKDKNSKIIYNSIRKSRYRWRTIEGISKETNLSKMQIESKLEELRSNGYVISSCDSDRRIYTTKEKYFSKRSVFFRIISVLSDEVK